MRNVAAIGRGQDREVRIHAALELVGCRVPGVRDRLDRGLRRGQAKLKAFGSFANGLGTKLVAGGASILAPLLGALKEFDGGGSDFTFGPFNFMLAYSDHVVVYVFYPLSHTESKLDVLWLVNGDAEEGKDYDLDALTWLWHETTLEDIRIIHDNWRGVRSKYYEPGPFSELEEAECVYVDWLLDELLRLTARTDLPPAEIAQNAPGTDQRVERLAAVLVEHGS